MFIISKKWYRHSKIFWVGFKFKLILKVLCPNKKAAFLFAHQTVGWGWADGIWLIRSQTRSVDTTVNIQLFIVFPPSFITASHWFLYFLLDDLVSIILEEWLRGCRVPLHSSSSHFIIDLKAPPVQVETTFIILINWSF